MAAVTVALTVLLLVASMGVFLGMQDSCVTSGESRQCCCYFTVVRCGVGYVDAEPRKGRADWFEAVGVSSVSSFQTLGLGLNYLWLGSC